MHKLRIQPPKVVISHLVVIVERERDVMMMGWEDPTFYLTC